MTPQRAETYRAVGGFLDQPRMEDLEFARRVRRRGPLARRREEEQLSDRHFLAKSARSFVMMNTFTWLFGLGVQPNTPAQLYGHIR